MRAWMALALVGCSASHTPPFSEASDAGPEDGAAALPPCPLVELRDGIQTSREAPYWPGGCLAAGLEAVRCEVIEHPPEGGTCVGLPGRVPDGPRSCRLEATADGAPPFVVVAAPFGCGGDASELELTTEVLPGSTYWIFCVLRPMEGCR